VRRRSVAEYVLVAICAVVAALLVQAYVVKPYRIPSESMASTLVPRDRVLVNKVVYRMRDPGRGEIIVIDSHALNKVLIKRVVGLPGERIALHGGVVYIDGRALVEPYVDVTGGRREQTDPFIGTGKPWSLERPYVIPAGHYFVMGDNREVSDDSRDWGTVPRSEIIGEAFFTYWPLNRAHGL
jgi:signal peptidase I